MIDAPAPPHFFPSELATLRKVAAAFARAPEEHDLVVNARNVSAVRVSCGCSQANVMFRDADAATIDAGDRNRLTWDRPQPRLVLYVSPVIRGEPCSVLVEHGATS